jgi:predicted NBD/HSP70 family sugar kinase
VAQRILVEAGTYLGIALAGIINLSNPSIVVVGGGVAQIGDLLLEPIRQTVRERCLAPSAQSVRITAAVLGRRSSLMGAIVQGVSKALYELTEGDFGQDGSSDQLLVGNLRNSLVQKTR